MNKTSRHYMLLFIMVSALLSMQWSNAHIHLAEHHDHDNSHHQHLAEAHSHQLTEHHVSNHHEDNIDSASHNSEKSVVSLAHDCHASKENKQNSVDDIATHSGFANSLQAQFQYIEFPIYINSQISSPFRKTDQPRAPPSLT